MPHEKKLLGLLKFTNFPESLKQGNIYMNNFEYFKRVEERNQSRGQGDSLEATLLLNDIEWKMTPHGSEEPVIVAKASRATFDNPEYLEKHLFCMTAITTNVLEVVDIDEEKETMRVKLRLPDKFMNEVSEEFGSYAALINAGPFIKRVEHAAHEQGIHLIKDLVDYQDFSINYSSRIHAFNEGNPSLFFKKDKYFEYQNEFRMVVLNGESEEDGHFEFELGSLDDLVTVVDIDTFLNSYMEFNLKLQKEDKS